MTGTGFRFFLEALQAQNTAPKPKPPKPKRIPRQTFQAPIAFSPTLQEEDYTGSVCLLHKLTAKTPAYEEVLLDIEDFDRLKDLSWRIDRWGRNKEKYAVGKNCVQLAAFILYPPAGKVAEHVSRRPLDNRRLNLRVGTPRQNVINTRRQKNGSSQYKGVELCKKTGRWTVRAGPRGQRVYLGSFTCEIHAARVYNEFALAKYGEFACLNPV